MKRKFIKYPHPDSPSIKLTIQVEPEPDGDYSIVSFCAEERRGMRWLSKEFDVGWFSKVLRDLDIDEGDVRMFIEDELAKAEEVL